MTRATRSAVTLAKLLIAFVRNFPTPRSVDGILEGLRRLPRLLGVRSVTVPYIRGVHDVNLPEKPSCWSREFGMATSLGEFRCQAVSVRLSVVHCIKLLGILV